MTKLLHNESSQGRFRLDFIHLLFLIGLFMVGNLLAYAMSQLSYQFLGHDFSNQYMQGLIYSIPFLFCIATYYFAFLKPKQLQYHFQFKISEWYLYPVMILFFLGGIIFNEPIANAIPTSGMNGYLDDLYRMMEDLEKMIRKYPITSSITIVILAPILEELVFRGMILQGLLNNGVSPKIAIISSSFIFGIIHFNPWQFVGAFFLGCIIGFVYYRTSSLLNTMLLHAFNNGLGLIVFFNTENMNLSESTNNTALQSLGIGLILLLVFGGLFAYLTQNKNGNITRFP